MENKKLMDSENLIFKVKFRPPKILKDYAPGALVEKDMKYVPKPGQKYAMGKHQENFWYQHTEADSFTRIRAIEVSDGQDTQTAIELHKEAKKRFPFKITIGPVGCSGRDNGRTMSGSEAGLTSRKFSPIVFPVTVRQSP